MFKSLCALFFLTLTADIFAFPFSQADAFSSGDGLAINDEKQSLIWLDFGVNNGKSINSVISGLGSPYDDWRLPTEAEVYGLWDQLSEKNGDNQLWSIFAVWGANKTPLDHLPFLCWGYFIDDDGYIGAGVILERSSDQKNLPFKGGYFDNGYVEINVLKKVIDTKYDGSDYFPFEMEGARELSTLLVKKSTVSEPSLVKLLIISFIFFITINRSHFN